MRVQFDIHESLVRYIELLTSENKTCWGILILAHLVVLQQPSTMGVTSLFDLAFR